jgi:hypothetical protein
VRASQRTGRSAWLKATLTSSPVAPRRALGHGTPGRVTLHFAEAVIRISTTRTDDGFKAARNDLLARAAAIRAGAFWATQSASAHRGGHHGATWQGAA